MGTRMQVEHGSGLGAEIHDGALQPLGDYLVFDQGGQGRRLAGFITKPGHSSRATAEIEALPQPLPRMNSLIPAAYRIVVDSCRTKPCRQEPGDGDRRLPSTPRIRGRDPKRRWSLSSLPGAPTAAATDPPFPSPDLRPSTSTFLLFFAALRPLPLVSLYETMFH